MANFFSAFSLPYKFPSRNKKENAAEITFVLKASPLPLLPSSIFRACSLIIEAERKKEGKRKAQVDNETDSSRVARSSSNRTAQQRLFDNTRDGRGDVSGRLSICPFNSPSRQSRKRVTLITSLPARLSRRFFRQWCITFMHHVDCIHTYIYNGNIVLEGNTRISFYGYSGRNAGVPPRYASGMASLPAWPRRLGKLNVVIVTLHHFFTLEWMIEIPGINIF